MNAEWRRSAASGGLRRRGILGASAPAGAVPFNEDRNFCIRPRSPTPPPQTDTGCRRFRWRCSPSGSTPHRHLGPRGPSLRRGLLCSSPPARLLDYLRRMTSSVSGAPRSWARRWRRTRKKTSGRSVVSRHRGHDPDCDHQNDALSHSKEGSPHRRMARSRRGCLATPETMSFETGRLAPGRRRALVKIGDTTVLTTVVTDKPRRITSSRLGGRRRRARAPRRVVLLRGSSGSRRSTLPCGLAAVVPRGVPQRGAGHLDHPRRRPLEPARHRVDQRRIDGIDRLGHPLQRPDRRRAVGASPRRVDRTPDIPGG